MKVLPAKHQQAGVPHGDYVGRSRLFVDHRHLAEEATLPQNREDDLPAILCDEYHFDLPRSDQEEGVAGVVFEYDHAALGVAALSSQVGEGSQVGLAQPGEEGDLSKDL